MVNMVRAYIQVQFKNHLGNGVTLYIMLGTLFVVSVLLMTVSLVMENDRLTVGYDSSHESLTGYELIRDLNANEDVVLIDVEPTSAKAWLTSGRIDLYMVLAEDIDTLIESGNYDKLITLYSEGETLASVFYPDMVLGSLMPRLQYGIVTSYIDQASQGRTGDYQVEGEEIFREYSSLRKSDYFIQRRIWQSDNNQNRDMDLRNLIHGGRIIGTALMLFHLMVILALAPTVEEKNLLISERLGVSPMSFVAVLLGQWLTGTAFVSVMAVIMAGLIMTVGVAGLGMALMLLLVLWLFGMSVLALQLMISYFSTTAYTYVLTSMVVVVVLSVLGGVFMDPVVMIGSQTFSILSPYGGVLREILTLLYFRGSVVYTELLVWVLVSMIISLVMGLMVGKRSYRH